MRKTKHTIVCLIINFYRSFNFKCCEKYIIKITSIAQMTASYIYFNHDTGEINIKTKNGEELLLSKGSFLKNLKIALQWINNRKKK